MKALLAISALAVGNFLYQLLLDQPNWLEALDRSFFQAIAIGLYVWIWEGK